MALCKTGRGANDLHVHGVQELAGIAAQFDGQRGAGTKAVPQEQAEASLRDVSDAAEPAGVVTAGARPAIGGQIAGDADKGAALGAK